MKKRLTIGVVIGIVTLGIVGCGGMSAPPVSLPTPVTGRITISAPDADGNITVTGESNSVTASSTVLAENETVTASLMDHIISAIISEAYATPSTSDNSCPSVYSGTGYQCTTADAEGAFTLTIAGSAGDSISVVLINASTGAFLSDPLTREVPDDVFAFAYPIVDLAVAPDASGYLLLLGQGATTADRDLLTIDPADGVATSTGIEFPASFGAVEHLAVGPQHYTAISSSDGNVVVYGESMSLVGTLDLSLGVLSSIWIDANDVLWVSNNEAPPSIVFVDPDVIADPAQLRILDSEGHDGSVMAMREGTYTAEDNQDEVALVASAVTFPASSSGGAITKSIMIYGKDDLIHEDVPAVPAGELILGSTVDIADIAFVDEGHMLMLTDQENSTISFYSLTAAEPFFVSEPSFTIAEVASIGTDDYAFLEKPMDIAHVGAPYVFVTALNGNDDRQDSVLVVNFETQAIKGSPIEVGLTPTGIVYDSVSGNAYVSCSTSQSMATLDVSTIIASD